MRKQNMTPGEIKIALSYMGISQSGLARDLNRSPSHIGRVIENPNRSFPVACHIAKALQMDLEEIWPETYGSNQHPPKPGRPLTKGLYNH